METIYIAMPSSLYHSLYLEYGESTTEAIHNALSNLVGTNLPPSDADIHDYPRPGRNTITGKVWEIADRYSATDQKATRQKVIDACLEEGINVNTANTQYSHWSKAPIQGSGTMRVWQNPDGTFKHLFLEIDLNCKPDHYPGVVIISSANHSKVLVADVRNLEKELPKLLDQIEGPSEVYWDFERKGERRKEIISLLSSQPVYVG